MDGGTRGIRARLGRVRAIWWRVARASGAGFAGLCTALHWLRAGASSI